MLITAVVVIEFNGWLFVVKQNNINFRQKQMNQNISMLVDHTNVQRIAFAGSTSGLFWQT